MFSLKTFRVVALTEATSFLLLGLAVAGLPGTLGFAGQDLVLHGAAGPRALAPAFAVLGACALNGIALMRAYMALFGGTTRHGGEVDLTRREGLAFGALLALLLALGLAPGPVAHALDGASGASRAAGE